MTATSNPVLRDPSDSPPQRTGSGVLWGLGLTVVSMVMMIVAQPSFGGLWPLGFVAVAPAIVAGYRFMPRRLSGLPVGLAWCAYWLAWALLSQQIAPMPLPVLVGVLFFGFGVLVAAFDRRLAERTDYRWFLLQLPVTWAAFDMLYQTNLFVGDEGQFGSLMTPVPLLLQPISFVGEIGLTFWLVMVNCVVALVVMFLLDRRRLPYNSVPVTARVMRQVAVVGIVVSLIWVLAAAMIMQQVSSEQGPSVKVAAIQVGPGTGFNPDGSGADTPQVHRQLVDLTKQAAEQGAKLAVWPEVILHFDPRTDPRQLVQRTARETGMYIQTGFTVGSPAPDASNMTGLWDPQGKLVGVYYKIHPVVMAGEAFVQPERFSVFQTDFGTMGMIICFDFSFEEPTRMMVRGGAQLMSASVGDWSEFGPARIGTVQLRAVENRVPFVKAEMLNGSALVDATGTVLQDAVMESSDGGEALVIGDLPLGPVNAPYTWLGPLFGYACVLLLALRIILQARLSFVARRDRRAESAASKVT